MWIGFKVQGLGFKGLLAFQAGVRTQYADLHSHRLSPGPQPAVGALRLGSRVLLASKACVNTEFADLHDHRPSPGPEPHVTAASAGITGCDIVQVVLYNIYIMYI